jgi:hypothetical protein
MMNKKSIFLFVTICSIVLCGITGVSGETFTREFRYDGQKLTVRLNGTPLEQVLETFNQETGIWFQCEESLLEKKISVQFENVSLHEGLNRILSTLNYSLVFNRYLELEGAIIVAEGNANTAKKNRDLHRNKPSVTSKTANRGYRSNLQQDSGSLNQESIRTRNPGNYKTGKGIKSVNETAPADVKNLKEFTIIKNSPPPGGPVEKHTTVNPGNTGVNNSILPDNSVNPPSGENKKFKIIRNVPPPGK